MLSQETIARYNPPNGDLFQSYETLYGNNGALLISQAAQSGDQTLITDAIVRVKYGERLDTSTFNLLWNQLTTDPLAAPLETFGNAVGQVFNSAGVKQLLYLGGALFGVWVIYKIYKDK